MNAPAAEPHSLCTFYVAGQRFGVETRAVHEVLGHCEVAPVPLAPPHLAGMAAYRGEVLTVLDLRALLDLPTHAAPARHAVVVLEGVAEEDHGLLIERLAGVLAFDEGERQPNPVTLDGPCRALFAGSFRAGDGLVVELSVPALRLAALRHGAHVASPPAPAALPPVPGWTLYGKEEPCAS